MVNGALSRILYLGAFGMIALLIVCITVLAIFDKVIPNELTALLTAMIAFVAGSHIRPPVEPHGKGE